jgi:hypothetical protein
MYKQLLVLTYMPGLIATFAISAYASTSGVLNVPQSNPAYAAVKSLVSKKVMTTSRGDFRGKSLLTRKDFAVILDKFKNALEHNAWKGSPPSPAIPEVYSQKIKTQSVNRYELAISLENAARWYSRAFTGSYPLNNTPSVNLPPLAHIKLSGSSSYQTAMNDLNKSRMLSQGSPLLQKSAKPLTASETARAISDVLIGLTHRISSEPQNKDLAVSPPPKKH